MAPSSADRRQTQEAAEPSVSTLAIGFLTTVGVNVGDEFIRDGIRHCLDRIGIAVEPYFVNKHDAESLSSPRDIEYGLLPDKILDCDVFVQSGAPVYWHQGAGKHRSVDAEWHHWAWEQRVLASVGEPVFLNLGAGSCQPWGDPGLDFVKDAECASFAALASSRAALTTVRDPVASDILSQLNISHHRLPCPALLAAGRFQPVPPVSDFIGVNLMPLGGHFDFAGNFDLLDWVRRIHELLQDLRKMGRIVFICHDNDEVRFAGHFATSMERVFYSTSYRDYLDMFRGLSCLFANRVHAAVAASGFGVPAIIAGTDTRARIGEWIGLDIFHANSLRPAEVAQRVSGLLRHRTVERERLLDVRERTLQQYVELIAPIVGQVRPRGARGKATPVLNPIQRWIGRELADSQWLERLGLDSHWVIQESGFHTKETYGDGALRWTDGTASLRLPPELEFLSDALELSLWGVHPEGHFCRVLVNGDPVLEIHLSSCVSWNGQAAFSPRLVESIVIESDVMQPEGDPRRLGVALRDLRIHRS